MNKLYLKHTRSDPLYRQAVQSVLLLKINNVSGLQREFRLGYSRALRLRDSMVAERIVHYDEVLGFTVLMTRANKIKKYLPISLIHTKTP
jgi:DNA segregation ATPase FtsK/SpoIIIE-like protein